MILGSTIDKAVNIMESGAYTAQEVYYSRLGTLSLSGYAIWDNVHRNYVEHNNMTVFQSKEDALALLKELSELECAIYTEEDIEL